MTIKRKKITGIILFLFPVPLLVLTLQAYAILEFGIRNITFQRDDDPDQIILIGQAISMVLALVGILAIIGLFIGTPFGIWMYISARKQEKSVLLKLNK